MRYTTALGLALIVCGCAPQTAPQSEPQEPQKWQRMAPIPDCLSDIRHREPSEGIPVVLDEKSKARLLEQLDQNLPNLREPFCWYEISSTEVLLRAGSTCNCPVDFHYRNLESNWSLTKIDVPQCDVRCEELNNIQIGPAP